MQLKQAFVDKPAIEYCNTIALPLSLYEVTGHQLESQKAKAVQEVIRHKSLQSATSKLPRRIDASVTIVDAMGLLYKHGPEVLRDWLRHVIARNLSRFQTNVIILVCDLDRISEKSFESAIRESPSSTYAVLEADQPRPVDWPVFLRDRKNVQRLWQFICTNISDARDYANMQHQTFILYGPSNPDFVHVLPSYAKERSAAAKAGVDAFREALRCVKHSL